jgi:hypothetical protein
MNSPRTEGRPDFILHISRLADIENRGVVPALHKRYTLATLYHLSPLEIFRWYEAPLEECFGRWRLLRGAPNSPDPERQLPCAFP